jgi:hypothetical protein
MTVRQPITINLIIRFNRESIRCQKIALKSLEAMKPNAWRDNAIARLSKRIALQEKILAEAIRKPLRELL